MSEPKISDPVIRAIQDAILLGTAAEIEGVLNLVQDDDEFPANFRYGLEALAHFRRFYGNGGELAPKTAADQKKIVETEVSWGRELLDRLQRYSGQNNRKCA
ncbi:MAG: hypothetical protein PHW76_09920 [Alphaproteobacteria bacterium]|nr:hypothetical protein [Alphaproteobacteria bacterium]